MKQSFQLRVERANLRQYGLRVAVVVYSLSRMPGRLRLPGINQDHAHGPEVAEIPGDDGHSMNQGGGGDERIAVGAGIGHSQRCASLCDRGVNRQDAAGECG